MQKLLTFLSKMSEEELDTKSNISDITVLANKSIKISISTDLVQSMLYRDILEYLYDEIVA